MDGGKEVTPFDLALWVAQADLAPAPPAVTEELLIAARELREAIDVGVRSRLGGGVNLGYAIAGIDAWLPAAQVPQLLTLRPEGLPHLGPAPASEPARHGWRSSPAMPRRCSARARATASGSARRRPAAPASTTGHAPGSAAGAPCRPVQRRQGTTAPRPGGVG